MKKIIYPIKYLPLVFLLILVAFNVILKDNLSTVDYVVLTSAIKLDCYAIGLGY